MAHSLFHAKSSARQFGGTTEMYLPIHNWFDATKALNATFRHRALRHHTQGIALAKQIFSNVQYNSQDCDIVNSVTIDEISNQHLWEDFQEQPEASKWWELIELKPWMDRKTPHNVLCKFCTRKFGGELEDYQFLCDFFSQFDAEDPRSRMILWHSLGIFTAEEVFGVTFVRKSDGKEMPTRTVAESVVCTFFSRIPSPEDWISSIVEQSFMYAKALQLSKDKDL